MTVLYLDTEFNGHHGELIAMALFSPVAGELSFYEAVHWREQATDWVRERVLPVLDKMPLPDVAFQAKLQKFLTGFSDQLIVVADWPSDFEHLFHWMLPRRYAEINIEMTCLLVSSNGIDLKPERPHNALSDARALWEWHRLTGYGLATKGHEHV